MLDFTQCPVVDNHCHVLQPEKKTVEPIGLAREFLHGMGDTPIAGVDKVKLWGATDDLLFHFPHMGVVLTVVCQLAKLFGCEPELSAVTAERNRRTAEIGLAGYAKLLYQDAGIVCSVMDSNLPINDPILDLTPGLKVRLCQMDPLLRKLIPLSGSYAELLRSFQESVAKAIRQDGFVGIKTHLGEQVGFGAAPVEADEAERLFPAAKAGDAEAFKKLYMAVWLATMLQAQDLNVPVHVHTGITGTPKWEGPVANTDPFLLVPILKQPRFLKTRLVLLHAAHPWMQHAGMMAHCFPHVWVDSSVVSPWNSQRIAESFRDLIAMAPLSKLMIGSGGSSSPEESWLAAKTAKIALGEVLTDSVRLGLMAERDAEKAGRMILHDNAARMYGLKT
ncbi:MAG: amidohydrolase family protein [Desulfobacteraceae bacterium]|nr:amidohydrolase family protein [Desulfobacteraceae bacterium]